MSMVAVAAHHGPSRSPMIQGRILRKWCNLFGVQDEVQDEYWWFHEICGSVF